MQRFREDTERTAIILLKDESLLELDEHYWPPSTHGDDLHACQKWIELTGLKITIRTKHLTSGDPPNGL